MITNKSDFKSGVWNERKIVFNREIAMDIMKIGEHKLLRVVDTGTHFGAAQFLDSEDVQSVWQALLKCWVLVYAGQPDVFSWTKGSVFTSKNWKQLADENGLILKFSSVQHHNGISSCERFHAPLRNIYRKIELGCPPIERDLVLQTAIKSMNDIIGPEGLVPSMLLFGIMPRYAPAGLEHDLPNQSDQLKAIRIAREEFFRITNNLRITRALRSKVPQAPSHTPNLFLWLTLTQLVEC